MRATNSCSCAQRALNAQAPQIENLGGRVLKLFAPYKAKIVATCLIVVVSAALGVIPPLLVDTVREVRAQGGRSLVGWSFYSPDVESTADDLSRVREALGSDGVTHLAGGVHATAERRARYEEGYRGKMGFGWWVFAAA